jgi:CIC family chloride channel protein
LLGILAGFVSISFIKSISYVEDTLNRFKIPGYLQPAMGGLFVGLNNKGELVGILSMRDLKNCLSDMDCLCELIVAADIMSKNVYCLVPDDTLETALEVFEGKHISTLPVVDPRNRKKVLGILKKSNLILAYNEKILKTHILQNRGK